MRPSPVAVVSGVLALAACGGPHFQRGVARPSPSAADSAAAAASASAAASSSAEVDPDRASLLLRGAIGCFVGGAWSEALGALGEERTLATTRRCRMLVTDALGGKPDDTAMLERVRSIDPGAVDPIARAIALASRPQERSSAVTFVHAVADAAREALSARRASGAVRAAKDAEAALHDAEPALVAKDALAKLHAMGDARARLVALVLAADHLDSARGLPPRGRTLAASPAFSVTLALPPPADDAWLPYLRAAAKAAGHPGDAEKAAFTGVVRGFADRFEGLAKELPASEERDVALGYAKRVRAKLAD